MPDKKTFRIPFPKTGLEFTGERFTTLAEGEIRHQHFHRYFFALQFCAGKSVLDIACGEGYGGALLATVASQVIGVDSADEAIRHATENYVNPNLTFQGGNATNLPVPSGSIDVVISFETLEHLSEHEQFLAEIKRVLCPGGLLVMSTPDRDFFAGSPPNPFHLKELRRPEFRELMEQVFGNSAFFVQSSLMGSVIAEDRDEKTRGNHEGFGRVRDNLFESAPGLPSGMYMIGIASDAELPEIHTGSFDDRQFQLGLYAELQRRHIELLRGEADIKNLREEIRLSSARDAESAAELLRVREALLRLEGEAGYLRNAQVAARDQEIELRVELRRREEERNLREETLLSLQNEIDRLGKQESEWRTSERQLQLETGRMKQREHELEASLSQKNEESRRLLGEVKRLEGEINTLRIGGPEAKSEVQRMRDYQFRLDEESAAALANLTLQREGYRQRIAERDLEIESVKQSLSWAISAPFRWIGSPLAKIRAAAMKLMYGTPAYRYTGKPLARLLSSFRVPGVGWLLPSNPLFDAQFYRTRYPDAAKGSKNLWAHYLSCGDDESRNPHPLFQSGYYKLRNSDVTASGINSLIHYFEHGAREGRDPSPDFDTSYYLELYPDVEECGVNPLLHFMLYGAAEGRRPVPGSPSKARILQPLRVNKSNEAVPAALAPAEERREPLISVIMPTFNTPRRYLLLAIESVLRQSYRGWELCIYDDGSSAAETLELLKEYRERDSRIRVEFGSRNQGIGAASNRAMALAMGRYVAMLDHDDVIVPEALLEIANVLNGDSAIDALYTDQAYVEADGSCVQPFFKPDWSPEMFRGVMFVGHLLVVRRTLAMDLGGFDTRFDRAQDFEFMLRVSEKGVKIHHLPKVLYHWRRIQGSVAFHGDQKGPIEPIQAAAVNAHLKRMNIPSIAEPHPTLAHRLTIKPASRKSAPSVLVVVRDANASDSECLSSILERSTYSNFQVLTPRLPHSANAVQDPRVMTGDTGVRNFGTADYVVWIDSDLELLTPDWIERLLLYCEQSQIACATPLILNCDGTVWDAGLVLGMNGLIGYPMRGLPADSDGYAGSLSCAREVTCASGACMMVSRQKLEALGDMVRYYQDSLYQGADLSLRAATAGFRNIVNPRVTLRRLDNSSPGEGCELDRELFRDRWGAIAKYGDRYYNPNFKLISPGYQMAETTMAAAV